MGHYAKVVNGVVEQVIVAQYNFIEKLPDADKWIKTSYNTRGGKHYAEDGITEDDKPAIRKNYAGVGFTYDPERDAFIPPKIYNSWVLDEETCTWVPPIPKPTDGKKYIWSLEKEEWIEAPVKSLPVPPTPAPISLPEPPQTITSSKPTKPYLIYFKN